MDRSYSDVNRQVDRSYSDGKRQRIELIQSPIDRWIEVIH